MKIQEEIDQLYRILDISNKETPDFINGIIIKQRFLYNLYDLLDKIIREAKETDKLRKQNLEWLRNAEKRPFQLMELIKTIKCKDTKGEETNE